MFAITCQAVSWCTTGYPTKIGPSERSFLSTWYERTRLRLYLRVPSWQSGQRPLRQRDPGQGRRNQPPLRLRWRRPRPARTPGSTADVRYKAIYVSGTPRPDRRNATTTGRGSAAKTPSRHAGDSPAGRCTTAARRGPPADQIAAGPGGRDRRVLPRRAPKHQRRIGRAGQVRAIEGPKQQEGPEHGRSGPR